MTDLLELLVEKAMTDLLELLVKNAMTDLLELLVEKATKGGAVIMAISQMLRR